MSLMGRSDGRGRFQRRAEMDGLPAGNAARYRVGVIGDRSSQVCVLIEPIVTARSAHASGRDARAGLEPLGGRDGEHGLGRLDRQLVEHRRPGPRRIWGRMRPRRLIRTRSRFVV